MIRSLREIDKNLIDEICNRFEEGYDISSLKVRYPFLDYNVIFSILHSTGKYEESIYDYICQLDIDDRKILIISDTHYGSIYENFSYTYKAFNFAVANGIHIILHGGDILEANVNQKRGLDGRKQADYFVRRYPSDNGVITYALLGNHDYLAININGKIRRILQSRNDINILGYKKTYIKWCGNIISLQHEIDKFKLSLPVNAECLSFKGHSHFYHVVEKSNRQFEKIYIPAMCFDPVYYMSNPQFKEKDVRPGFLVAEIDAGDILVTNYSFASKEIVRENEYKKVLKRN